MIAKGRPLLAASLLAALSATVAPAQPPPPAPTPVLPPASAAPPPPTLGPPAATPFPGPPAPPPPAFNAPHPEGNGLVDAPSDEGWFFDVELDFTKPHVKDRVSGPVTFPGGGTATMQAKGAPLDWTVAPRFDVGYRFDDDFGELSAGYRFLTSEGSTNVSSTFGPISYRSRLDLNEFDFDYSGARFSPGPFWDLQWRVGVRLADVFFDSRDSLDGLADLSAGNNFLGAGPHFGLDAERRFGLAPGLAAFGRIDGAVLIGRVRQHFHEGLLLDDGTTFAGDDTRQGTQTVPVLSLQAGLSYTPPRMDFLHFTGGYEFEDWWNVGRLGGSRGELMDQGIFVRGEFDY